MTAPGSGGGGGSAGAAHASSALTSSGPSDGGAEHSANAAVQAVTAVLRERHAGKDIVDYLAHVAAVVRLYDRIEDVPVDALSFEGAADAAAAAGVNTSASVLPPASPGARARLSGHQRAASSGAAPSALASALRTTPPPGGASISSGGGGGGAKPGARPAAAQVTAAAALGSRARAHAMPSAVAAAASASGARGAAARPATTRSGSGVTAPTPPPRPPSASAATRTTAPSPTAGGAAPSTAARPSTATSATPRSTTRPAAALTASAAAAATPRTAATAAARAVGTVPAVPARTGAVAPAGARPAAAGAAGARPVAGPTGRAPVARPPGVHAATRPAGIAVGAQEHGHAVHGASHGTESAAGAAPTGSVHAHAEPQPQPPAKATTSDAEVQTDAPVAAAVTNAAPPAATAAAAASSAAADASALTRVTSRDLVDMSLSLQPSAVGTMAANTGAAAGLQWDVDFAGAVDANGLPNEDAFFGVRLFGMPFVLCVGVCDGHSSDKRAGKAASHLSCNNMFPLVMQYYDAKKRSREVSVDMEGVFASTFKKIEQIMRGVEGPKKIFDYAGTTATCVVVMKSEKPDARYDVHCANVGDSEVLLCGVDGFDVLTTKHNASDAAEVARAQAEGAFVTDNNYGKRVNGLLVTRSLGDLGCEGTISTPAYRVASVDRRPCVVVMGSDGFWDMMPYAFVHEMALSMREQALSSEAMCARFLETVKARYEDHNHRDNITVCVALL